MRRRDPGGREPHELVRCGGGIALAGWSVTQFAGLLVSLLSPPPK
ncbi:hypothetical protein [Nonomuraea angiospora]